MLEIIEQLFGMFAVIGALYASSQMMLVAESSDDPMMFTSLQQAPPTASDWGNAQCVRRTRFSVAQIHLLLAGLDMLRPDGSSKTYRVYPSYKLYWKRRLNGRFSNGGAKYFYVSAETALLVLLINLARPIAFCDMQASLDGMPLMYNNFSVLFTFPTVYRCASATQVDECRPRFSFGIYWRVGTVAKLQCNLEFPPPCICETHRLLTEIHREIGRE